MLDTGIGIGFILSLLVALMTIAEYEELIAKLF